MKPAVITSRAAQQDFDKIKVAHADLITGMANQSQKILGLNQQKEAAMANENSMKMQLQKDAMAANTEAQKTALDFQMKQSELDVKRASMSAI